MTISVDSGYFTVPALGSSVLTFIGGTNGSSYINTYSDSTQYNSAVFSFTDAEAAEALLGAIIYTPVAAGRRRRSRLPPASYRPDRDLYFEGHFYRYVSVRSTGLTPYSPPAARPIPISAGAGISPRHEPSGKFYPASADQYCQSPNRRLL